MASHAICRLGAAPPVKASASGPAARRRTPVTSAWPVVRPQRPARFVRAAARRKGKKSEDPVVFTSDDLKAGRRAPDDVFSEAEEVEVVIMGDGDGDEAETDAAAAVVEAEAEAGAAEEVEPASPTVQEEVAAAAAEMAQIEDEVAQAAKDVEEGIAQAAQELEGALDQAAKDVEEGMAKAADDLEAGIEQATKDAEAGMMSAFGALADAVGARAGASAEGGVGGVPPGGWEGGGVGGVGWDAISREELKARVLSRAAATSRGQVASSSALGEMMGLIAGLESKNPTVAPMDGNALSGTWVLCFASVQIIRSSPFFRAFKEVLGPKLAEEIYAFTDALPGVAKGQAIQVIDTAAGKLDSEVDLRLVPLPYLEADGTMVTKSTFDITSPDTMSVTVETTQVTNNTLPGFDQFVFPMRQAFDLARADGVPVSIRTSYLDEDLRVARYDDGTVFVYTRK